MKHTVCDGSGTWFSLSGMGTLSSKYVEKGSSWATGEAGGEIELYWFVWTPFSWGESSDESTAGQTEGLLLVITQSTVR